MIFLCPSSAPVRGLQSKSGPEYGFRRRPRLTRLETTRAFSTSLVDRVKALSFSANVPHRKSASSVHFVSNELPSFVLSFALLSFSQHLHMLRYLLTLVILDMVTYAIGDRMRARAFAEEERNGYGRDYVRGIFGGFGSAFKRVLH